jgi:hypothetical protein
VAGTVTSSLTNITNAEAADASSWIDIGGGAGSSNGDEIVIQGSEARGRRVDNNIRGFTFDNGSGIDLSAEKVLVGLWVFCAQPKSIDNTNGYGITFSSHATDPTLDRWIWRVFTSTSYPDVGGWQRIWLDINRLTPGVTTGSPDNTALRLFGIIVDMLDVTGTSPNNWQDRTDYLAANTIALVLDAGTAPSPATFQDFIDADEGTSGNKYGIWQSRAGVFYCSIRSGIGDDTATVFNDSGFVVVFPNQTQNDGEEMIAFDHQGLTVDLQNASTDIDMADGLIRSEGPDHYGDFVVLHDATPGDFDASAVTFDNLRRMKLCSSVTLDTCRISSGGQIDPTNGDYTGEMALDTDEYVETTGTIDISSTSNDFEIFMLIKAADYTPTAIETLASHSGGTVATEEFWFQLHNTGVIRVRVSDGTGVTTFSSSSLSNNIPDGYWCWVRVKYDHDGGTGALVSFFYSIDPADTPVGDISWTAIGTDDDTARAMQSSARVMQLGANDDTGEGNFFNGSISYFELWTDGFQAPGAGHGDLRLRADWRTGPAFVSTQRADDFDSSFTWDAQGTSPTYTLADNNTGAATFTDSSVADSTSEAALRWNVNTDPNGELDNMTFESAGTGHAIELGPNTPSTITLTNHTYTGYAGSDGSTGNEVIYNNSNKSITINSDVAFSVRDGTGASTTKVISPVTVLIHVEDENGVDLQNARVAVWAADGTGIYPFEETLTSITRSGSVATVTHTAHGMVTGDYVVIGKGVDQVEYSGIHQITVTGANTYTYTVSGTPDSPATGTLEGTGAFLSGLTNASGDTSRTRAVTTDTPVEGFIRKSTAPTRYKTFDLAGNTVDDVNGLTVNVRMIPDE